MTDRAHRQETRTHLLPDHLQQPDGGRRWPRRNRTRLALLPALPIPIRGDPGGSAMHESPRAPLIAAPGPYPSQVAAMGKARAVEEVTGAAHGDQQRTAPLELSHRISPAGEVIVDLGGELDIASAEMAVSYVRDVIDRHRRPVKVDLTTLAFCDPLRRRRRRLSARTGRTVSGQACDVTSERAVADLIDQVLVGHGRLDILVTSAGVQARGTLDELGVAALRACLEVNVVGTWLACRAAATGCRVT